MKSTVYTKIFERELRSPAVRSPHLAYRSLYSQPSLIADLDIVNELDGHSGCVNALSWSKTGNLLASGSDDQHLNIHQYLPRDDGSKQFKLVTTVATGHTQNIFSVKFMPGHDDRICVTAAGDGEVRVFDLEYSGGAREASVASSLASEGRRRGRNTVYNGVTYLSDGDTDCRVYGSHGDRVKRIVTESSPFLFLSCSEDGEVRQWDLRQPSSAYPAPRGTRWNADAETGVPPALISYKRYNLDLNTISCSPSQPHYIALGGAHLHCFLHDRRMTGRDRLREAGRPLSSAASRTSEDEELMAQATQCVRKFAPRGQQRMKRTENGHITACKISDARPDEMVVSWSGDHIYSFDLVRSPDAREPEKRTSLRTRSGSTTKRGQDRKRKRKATSDDSLSKQESAARGSSRPRTDTHANAESVSALRVRYRNGQSEDIPISDRAQSGIDIGSRAHQARRIAGHVVAMRDSLFNRPKEGTNPAHAFTTALQDAAALLSEVDEVMREWGYPMDPSEEQVRLQQTLRGARESTRRFIQAAGTLARVVGGQFETDDGGPSSLLAHFTSVEPRSNDLQPTEHEQFGYDFLKAILLWLESGMGRLNEGFTRPAEMLPTVKAAARLPIPESESSVEAIDEYLIPYLLRLARDRPVINVDANSFEVDENRQTFVSEKAAVLAFAAAVKIPFADLSSAVVLAEESTERLQAQDRQTAMKFWGRKIARGILLNAAEGVKYTFVDRAFGGIGRVLQYSTSAEERFTAEVESEEDEPIGDVEIVGATGNVTDTITAEAVADATREARGTTGDASEALLGIHAAHLDPLHQGGGDPRAVFDEDLPDRVPVDADDTDEDDMPEQDDDGDSSDEGEEEDDDSSGLDEIDGVPQSGLPRFMYTSAFERRRRKEKVEADIPCYPYTREYRGHCNVRTVKDVNYFGLDDEYVVSGSDDGNLFIWDRKSSQLVNILEGDGEVVNVIQGHPYEAMMAVSGIDHTIKIFSPDFRARAAARLGVGVSSVDSSQFSSIQWPRRIGRRRGQPPTTAGPDEPGSRSESNVTSEPPVPTPSRPQDEIEDEDEEYVAPTGLTSRKRIHDQYRIVNKNDMERQGGNQDAFITRSMLAQLAARIRAHRAGGDVGAGGAGGAVGEGEDEDEEDDLPATIVLGEDCAVQ
ncbi:WD40 repeat-like protein [Teratosphaeria nubilosa]|uniref:WD40 repeat-like protein n=1 Tax=Teratosphaeria nubilosa TaxID=161662 RepID=A0A6G1KWF9_9PEZI|nr:WD40 repeat-like protein [Teratosphaeria nubilosa]